MAEVKIAQEGTALIVERVSLSENGRVANKNSRVEKLSENNQASFLGKKVRMVKLSCLGTHLACSKVASACIAKKCGQGWFL